MITKLIAIVKNKAIRIYFGLLFVLLSFIYFSSFFHPPRSDYWPAFYFFYRISILAGPHKWKYILLYDPLINTTFRPISFLILYFERLFFGSNFVYYNFINFILYFISILLLYKLAINFCKSKILTVVFLGVFAFLFSHFDIVCWSFHSHIILSFCLFLLGFILYINYLKLNRKILLVFVIILFLLGMLMYETFLFWPISVIILHYINKNGANWNKIGRAKSPMSYISVIVSVYIFYSPLFLLDRTIRAHHGPSVSLHPLFSMNKIISNFFIVFFNILYNNFLINLVPQIAYPLQIDENLNIGGLIVKYNFVSEKIIFLGGGLPIFIFLFIIAYLFKRKLSEIVKVLMFFIFLLFSELFVLFHTKSLINSNLYNLTQFRFQYIPNALFTLMVLFLIDRFLKSSKRKKFLIYLSLFLILISNIQATRQGISILNAQLSPLNKLLSNIKIGIKNGKISKENRLFIDSDIAKKLPPLCWNKEMGERCMRGTYQWLFSKKEIECFSSFEDAKWVINEKDFSIASK